MSRVLRENCVFSHPGITIVTWNTCGWSFVAIQEYGRAQRDRAELGGHRLLYQPCAGSRRAPAIILHEDEAKGIVVSWLNCGSTWL